MPFTYILKCNDDTYYTGTAKDLENRISQHNAGKGAKYTRGRTPVSLVYFEEFETVGEALKREKEIQKLRRTQKEKLINNMNVGLNLVRVNIDFVNDF
ncbi:MAG: hypothetical protein A2086_14260 [Spirochaetes bacterium GWD1_27_9]|nr:MAG: hypothetical protein A2Z98_09260 [Spirochaetes bacterium GWB1_27_13]OHD23669.1 MAG: hypothetical protein A2Y34_15400 [Spirochaetes bacterium GWC1_27_15]OHD29888.1 MAG: hypothetical protein A2086_14260 [Spirochaetes bacterium GWD1_27_9]